MEISLSKTVLNNSNISSNRDSVIKLTNGYKILMIMWLLRIVVTIFIVTHWRSRQYSSSMTIYDES